MTHQPPPERSTLLSQLAALQSSADLNGAQGLCHDALRHWPDDPDFLRPLAQILMARNDLPAALKVFAQLGARIDDDGWMQLLWGLASERASSMKEADLHYQRALACPRTAQMAKARLGRLLFQKGHVQTAVEWLEECFQALPRDATIMSNLGCALVAAGQAERGLDLLRQAIHIAPAHDEIVWNAVLAFIKAGQAETIHLLLEDRLRDHPDTALTQRALVLANLRRHAEALPLLEKAVQQAPDLAWAWLYLADMKAELKLPGALECNARAKDLAPDQPHMRLRYAAALNKAGRPEEAIQEYTLCMPWLHRPETWHGKGLSIGIFVMPREGTTPTRFLINHALGCLERIPVIEGADYPAHIAQRYDIIFNAATDADAAGDRMSVAQDLALQLKTPILNPPDRILNTTRDRMVQRLRPIAGTVVPMTLRCTGSTAARTAPNVGFPLLVRPTGSHGGKGIMKVEDQAELDAYVHDHADAPLYLTKFVDYQSADGLYRKYRVVFVAGEILPYHLSVSSEWLNHYFRGLMADQPHLRAEEHLFLNDPATALGSIAFGALTKIAETIDLDYFGIDFSVDAHGHLLVFECNATMLVDVPQGEIFAYRRPAALRIQDSMSRLLRQRARTRAPG